MATIHEYPVSVTWHGGVDGNGMVRAERILSPIEIGVPPEFRGLGGGTNPEELFTASVASCYCMTLGIMAANKKLPLIVVEAEAFGEVEQDGFAFTFKSVTIKPRIRLDVESTDEEVALANDLAHKADAYCIITNAIRGKIDVIVEPVVILGEDTVLRD